MEPTLAQQLETTKAEKNALEAKLKTADAKAATASEELATAQANLKTANDAKAKAEADLAASKATAGEQATKITKLEGDVTKLTAEVDKTKKILAMHPQIAVLFHDGEPEGKHAAGHEAGAGAGSLLAKYNNLRKTSPRAASKFWRENEKAIQEEQKTQG